MSASPVVVSNGPVPHNGRFHAASAVLPAPKVLLFDLDGTLIYGTPRILARELYVATCGLPFIRQLESIFPGDSRNAHASELFEGRKPSQCDRIRMSPEVERALVELKGRGIAIVVSSNNGVGNVATFARNAGFPFDLVLGFGDGLAKGRPHIDRAAAEFGVRRDQMLFVGDSLHDGEIAEAEGIPFVGLAGTFSFERFAMRFPHLPVVRRFGELTALIAAGAETASPGRASRQVVRNG
jgi:phosphoglycolate phosphatase-like HAD superfamily hydrolase